MLNMVNRGVTHTKSGGDKGWWWVTQKQGEIELIFRYQIFCFYVHETMAGKGVVNSSF